MAISNQERVSRGMELLRGGLGPYVEREVMAASKAGAFRSGDPLDRYADDPMLGDKRISQWDASGLLRLMWDAWNDVFRRTLGHSERNLVSELREARNRWAHQEPFSSDDTDRALDSMARLLTAVAATAQAEELQNMKTELRREVFAQQLRNEKKKAGGSLVEAAASGMLRPWRDVVFPHPDVASGRYQQAEFAADLWQIHIGQGTDEYRKPQEFFRRTYLTESLKRLLVGAVRRISGQGGDPVVQLQTNFGGGKTHSMLALYHLFSGMSPADLAGVDEVMAEAGVTSLPRAKSVVLVGNKISPGNPVTKPDGTVVRTLWGELVWQLGGKSAFERIARDDEHATSPGDILREIFDEHGPCLILVDEWVAYARMLHDASDLAGGSFETQFTFAQSLTESAKLAKKCLLVVSLPASDTASGSPSSADDVEVGGIRGREALDRLRNVVGRIDSSWRPATAEEGFEIVRRRLFEPIPGPNFVERDKTAAAFSELYHSQSAEFPPDCRGGDYERRMQAAYPIHPEIFDQLYGTWSTLVKFQRTRGVLRLMAGVIHCLWEKGDKNPLILPSTIPIDDARVQWELTRYLSDNWVPILEKDVDGPNSLPLKIDNELPNLGKLHATRRVARTIYLGSAPTSATAHQGIEDRRVRLGCVMPGEPPQVFGDALRRLALSARFLYQEGNRFWYSTRPTVTREAEDRAEQLKREPDKVIEELERRLRHDLRSTGDFFRVHPLPASSSDVPDDHEAKLVVLGPNQACGKESGNPAEVAAKSLLESRGTTPRMFRNTLVFAAPDKIRYQDLEEALRKFLAWESILREKESLNLDPHQVRQAENQRQAADGAVVARLPEAYCWVLVPTQKNPQAAIGWEGLRLSGTEPLAVRVSKKLRQEELLLENIGSTNIRRELDAVPLWPQDHVQVSQLIAHFASFIYLPRLTGPKVLTKAISTGLALQTWPSDSYAFAESYDETTRRYLGLQGGALITDGLERGLLVKPEPARKQMDRESNTAPQPQPNTSPTAIKSPSEPGPAAAPTTSRPKRFYGTVQLDAARAGRDASKIAEEIIAHLVGQVGSDVTVTLDIEAVLPEGASEQLVRTVMENGRTLKFKSQGFEAE